jgi:two-component system phosphate regulon response regulator PhoB
VEDDAALVALLRYHFERENFEVRDTPSGQGALRLVQEAAPDVVLLDWTLDDLSGLEVCRRLRKGQSTRHVPILMLTARNEESDRIRGLEVGADDYVTKPFSPRELIARVRALLRRARPALAGEMLSFADLEMDLASHKVRRGGRRVDLGPTEFRLLRYFLENPVRVISRGRLLSWVWGHDRDIDARTVDVHVRRLRSAINTNGAPDLIRTIRSVGYALDIEQ